MKNIKTVLFILILPMILLFSCEDNTLWVGKKEHIVIKYSNGGSVYSGVLAERFSESEFITYESVEAVDLGNGTIQIILDGVRIVGKTSNFEMDSVNIYEKENDKFIVQDEFDNVSFSSNTDIAAVLVLDMSTSLGDLVSDLKSYSKSFVDIVVSSTPNSKVAVVFFSGRDNILTTGFYDSSNASSLKSLIDSYTDYQNRTALFEATTVGLTMLDSLEFDGIKSLVVFTDGGDNDSNNEEILKQQIADNDYTRFAIGLKGNDFSKNDLQAIPDNTTNSIIADKPEDLENIFDKVARQVVSVYKIVYERSDQVLDNSIYIKFEFEVSRIK